jgi:hypothetical protein
MPKHERQWPEIVLVTLLIAVTIYLFFTFVLS